VTARGKARKRALDVLYASELRGVAAGAVLREGPLAEGAAQVAPAANPYVATLVEGVVAHQVRIDELLSTYSAGWALDRMPAVDRNVLRIGVYELLWRDDVPDAVVIDEAVNLVRGLSTDESPAFVNGVLARILDLRPRLAV
jgi:transcription antitermination protein NusB